jgi:hypothetical protein
MVTRCNRVTARDGGMIRCIKGLDVEHMLLPCLVYAIKQKMVSLGDRLCHLSEWDCACSLLCRCERCVATDTARDAGVQ